MAKISKKGIVTGVLALAVVGALFSPDKKIETITLSIDNLQPEYDLNTEIPISISVSPENADTSLLQYHTNSYSATINGTSINTGILEGNYDFYVSSGDIKSNTLSINIIDITAREEAAKAEEERLAKEQALAEAEAQKQAEELAAKEAELQEQSEKLAAQEAELESQNQEQTKSISQESVNEQTGEESQAKTPEQVQSSQDTLNNTASNSTGSESNFNTYDNASQQQTEATYVLNTNTMKIHHPSCKSVKKIAPQNYSTSNSSVDELISQGYSTCGICF